tara:strand:+ start:96362 stop:97906 length:1545 start_codon:yes stop_codon:yes gene_type:complete
MFDMEKLVQELNARVLLEEDQLIILETSKERLESTAVYLKNHMGFVFLKLVNTSGNADSRKVWYWFENIETGAALGLFLFSQEEGIPSLSSVFKNAKHLEQMCFEEILESDYLSRSDELPPPKKSVEAAFVNPSVREVFNPSSFLSVDGELETGVVTIDEAVQYCKVFSGRYHSGFEKQISGKHFDEVAKDLLTYDGYQGIVWSNLFLQALEKRNHIAIPDKAQAIRIIFIEFARMQEHLQFLANIAQEAKAKSFHLTILKWSLVLERLLRQYTGNSLNLGILTLGGVNRVPPVNWLSTCIQELAKVGKEVSEFVEKLSKSSFWRQLDEVAPLQPKLLIDWSIQGPALRASGINFDLRKRRPTYLYDELEFQTPIGVNGSLYDRFLVRFEEIAQSISIISQLLDNLPTDGVVAKGVPHFSHLSSDIENNEESYEASILKSMKLKDGEYYSSMEAASGSIQIFFSLVDNKVYDLKLGTDYLSKLLCLEEVSFGITYENLGLLLKSMHINQKALEK